MVNIPIKTLLSKEWKSLKASTRCIYLIMLWRYGERKNKRESRFAMAQTDIVQNTGFSIRTVKDCIAELREKGWIEVLDYNESLLYQGYTYRLNPKYADGVGLTIQEDLSFFAKATLPKWKGENNSHWRKTRLEVLYRDHYICTSCGSTDNVVVHHLTYENAGHEKMEDLTTLCSACHRLTF